jgi:hypothetical protein
VGACFAGIEGCSTIRARQTFQSLMSISFPKIVGGGEIEICAIFEFFSNIFRIFAELHFFA